VLTSAKCAAILEEREQRKKKEIEEKEKRKAEREQKKRERERRKPKNELEKPKRLLRNGRLELRREQRRPQLLVPKQTKDPLKVSSSSRYFGYY
jgi:hypothetical protein